MVTANLKLPNFYTPQEISRGTTNINILFEHFKLSFLPRTHFNNCRFMLNVMRVENYCRIKTASYLKLTFLLKFRFRPSFFTCMRYNSLLSFNTNEWHKLLGKLNQKLITTSAKIFCDFFYRECYGFCFYSPVWILSKLTFITIGYCLQDTYFRKTKKNRDLLYNLHPQAPPLCTSTFSRYVFEDKNLPYRNSGIHGLFPLFYLRLMGYYKILLCRSRKQ